MPRNPQRIHHMLPDQGGSDIMETLCGLLITPIRDAENRITVFRTRRAGSDIQIMFDPRGVSCNICQRVWKDLNTKEPIDGQP